MGGGQAGPERVGFRGRDRGARGVKDRLKVLKEAGGVGERLEVVK